MLKGTLYNYSALINDKLKSRVLLEKGTRYKSTDHRWDSLVTSQPGVVSSGPWAGLESGIELGTN